MAKPEYPDSFEAAMQQIHSMQEAEQAQPGFNPAAKTIALTHGQKTRKAVLWFHGYTDTPQQFRRLAELCYQQGYNALVPCVPHHGFLDRCSPHMSLVKYNDLIGFTGQMVDLAHGLGEEVAVAGLSMGGAMAAWVGQERADVKLAMPIAPFLGAQAIPARLTRLVAYGMQYLPDIQEWWDSERKEQVFGSPYAYVKRSHRSLAQILRMGFQVQASAARRPPAAESIWMIINDADESVDNRVNQRLYELWKKQCPERVQCYHFPVELGIPHDCINAEQPKGRPDLVYAELMKRIG